VTNAALFVSMLLALDPGAAPRSVVAKQWQALRVPADGPALSIGTCNCGCLQGAATLPVSGPGYEVLHLDRNRRFGHPLLVAYVERLAKAARRAKLGPLVIGDLSQPRGGPTPTGHRSHQTGLDADIGYVAPPEVRSGHLKAADRERLMPPDVIDLKTHAKTRVWTPKVISLLALAANDPTVDRIFVNPAIKKRVCEAPATAHASWQSRLRPWWGHQDHFHVRLKCPPDSPQCVPQDPPPNDGCGPHLAWWFGREARNQRGKKEPPSAEKSAAEKPLAEKPATEKPPVEKPPAAEMSLPPACAALMTPPAPAAGQLVSTSGVQPVHH
jgi:penicillin-insensitive murein DD-endopeptidase